MVSGLRIRSKIILAITTILVMTLAVVTLVVSIPSGVCFNDGAKERLNIATRVVLADVESKL
ncbi:MAG: hypothetical protein WCP34_07075 [Pseudomonadota bacterium]